MVSKLELEGVYMPKRVEEVRLRMERFLLLEVSLSSTESASIREESLACREKSREGVVGEEGEESVEVGVRS